MIASPRLKRHKRRHCEGIITGTFYEAPVCAFTVYNLSTTSTPCNSRKMTTSKFTLASGSECLFVANGKREREEPNGAKERKVYWTLIINASEVSYNFLEWRYIHIVRIHWASERRVRTAKARRRTDGTNLFYRLVPEGEGNAKERKRKNYFKYSFSNKKALSSANTRNIFMNRLSVSKESLS